MDEGRLSDTRLRYISFFDATLSSVQSRQNEGRWCRSMMKRIWQRVCSFAFWEGITLVNSARASIEESGQFEFESAIVGLETVPDRGARGSRQSAILDYGVAGMQGEYQPGIAFKARF